MQGLNLTHPPLVLAACEAQATLRRRLGLCNMVGSVFATAGEHCSSTASAMCFRRNGVYWAARTSELRDPVTSDFPWMPCTQVQCITKVVH